MQVALSEEQVLLKDALSGFLADRYRFADRVATARAQPGFDAALWQALTGDLGLGGMAIPAEHGGLASDFADQMVVMEECGRALLVEPLAESCFLAAPLLARLGGEGAAAWLPRIASGEARVVLAVGEADMGYDLRDIALSATRTATGWRLDGTKSVVVAGPWAQALIVAARSAGERGDTAGLSLFLVPVETPGVDISAYPTLDERRAADIRFDGVLLPDGALLGEAGQALESLEWVRDRAIALQAAEATGLLDRLVADTIAYCRDRQQFGQPLSSFQVLQHRMVDMFLHTELTRSAALLAAGLVDGDPRERALAASAAKVTVAQACRFVGQNAVQLHGGMGMTDELPIGHYFKRATVIEREHGSADFHLRRHASFA
jgi:alkylation response protein AidB-like acyl-CoA dehydrogenase